MPEDRNAHSSADEKLPVRLEQRGGWTVLHLLEASLMSPAVIDALGAHVERLLGEGKKDLVLDFAQVQYISSSMIGVLVGARQSVSKTGGRLVLAGLNPRLRELLKITRMEKMFTQAPDVETAVGEERAT
jgi:anti-sigma B factor antagonist